MNPYLITLCAVIACWGFYQHSELTDANATISSYGDAAKSAKADAQKQEQADLASLKSQSVSAISQALQGQKTAETALQSYLARGRASGGKDIGHECFSVPIPADEIP